MQCDTVKKRGPPDELTMMGRRKQNKTDYDDGPKEETVRKLTAVNFWTAIKPTQIRNDGLL